MAAGLTLLRKDLQQFDAAFDDEVRRHLSEEDLQGIVLSDGELPPADLNLDFALTLRNAAPWGQAFPEPVFDGRFEILDRRVVGEKHLKLLVRPSGSERTLDAIWFNAELPERVQAGLHVFLAYRLDVNEYRGRVTPQLVVVHLDPVL